MSDLDDQSFQERFRVSLTSNEQPTRTRFSLLTDLPQAPKGSQPDSPFNMYFKDLEDSRSNIEKQNYNVNDNRKEKTQQSKKGRDSLRQSGEKDEWRKKMKRSDLKQVCNGSSFKECLDKVKQKTRKPGIYFYKKVINLNQPPPSEQWMDDYESSTSAYHQIRSPYHHQTYNEDQLFTKALNRPK